MNFINRLTLRGVAFFGIFVHIGTLLPLMDPDYFWHLRAGEVIVANRALPLGDVFSFTHFGKPWILHEWLFEVLLYGVHRVAGDVGIRFLVASFAVSVLLVSYFTARRFVRSGYVAFMLTLVLYAFLMQGLTPRPQLLTYLFFALTLRILMGFKYWGEKAGIWSLPLLMLPWVNAHAGYAIGLGLIALFLIAECLQLPLSDKNTSQQREGLKGLSIVLVLTLLITLINPYGYHHWLYPFQVMGMDVALSYISEWRSPNFHVLIFKIYLLCVLGYFVLGAYRSSKPDGVEVIIPAAMASLGFVSVRHVPLAALVLMPFMARALADRAPLHGRSLLLKDRIIARYKRLRGKDLGGKESVLNVILLVGVAIGLPLYATSQTQIGQQDFEKMVPAKAVDFMVNNQIQCRLLSTYHFGGYLIYRLYPDQRVFIDGRADMYGDAFMKEYIEASSGSENWDKVMKKYEIDCVLVGRDVPLRQLLMVRGDFAQVYTDENHAFLVARLPHFGSLIRRAEAAPQD